MRATDAVCRYGGEEFTLLLPETPAEDALVVVKRVQAQLTQLDLRPRGELILVTASWGLVDAAAIAATALSSALLLDHADEALYSAKRSGRDCARIWSAPALMS